MCNNMIEIIGHHGTDHNGEQGILRDKKFNPSVKEDEWIGHGIYFFHSTNSQIHAEEWAVNVKKFKFFSILESKILVDKDRILDLNNEEYQDVYSKYREAKIEEYRRRRIKIIEDETNVKKLDCHIINEIADKGKFLLVCQRRYIELRKRNGKEKLVASNIPNCNIMCVRSNEIIDRESIRCLKRGHSNE